MKSETFSTSAYFLLAVILAAVYYVASTSILLLLSVCMMVTVYLNFQRIGFKTDPLFMTIGLLLLISAISMAQVIVGIVEEVYPGGIRYIPNTRPNQIKTFYIICLSFICILPFFKSERFKLHQSENNSNPKTIYFLMTLIALTSVVANPVTTLLTHSYGGEGYGGDVFGAGIIGGWRSIVIVLYATYAIKTGLRKRRELLFTVLIVGYWLLHGSRAEIVGVVFCYFVMNYDRISKRNKIIFVLLTIVAIAIFQVIGDIRGIEDLSYEDLYTLVVRDKVFFSGGGIYISTVDPVNYSLLSLVYALDNNIMEYAYFDYFAAFLGRTLPSTWDLGFERGVDLATILDIKMSTVGGAHFVGEAYYSFGTLGVVLYAFGVFYLFRFVRRSQAQSEMYAVYYLSLLMLAPRYTWYGSIYLYKIIILFLVIRVAYSALRMGQSFTGNYFQNAQK